MEQMRKRFEAWGAEMGYSLQRWKGDDNSQYESDVTMAAWLAYQEGAQSQWRPISECKPRLGECFLMYDKAWCADEPVVGTWDFVAECWVDANDEHDNQINPSHFQYLTIPKEEV